LVVAAPIQAGAADPEGWIARFDLPESGLALSRPARSGRFFDVTRRRAAAFGYETRALEVGASPLKLVQDFKLAFRLEGYPLAVEGTDAATAITVRPEATVIT